MGMALKKSENEGEKSKRLGKSWFQMHNKQLFWNARTKNWTNAARCNWGKLTTLFPSCSSWSYKMYLPYAIFASSACNHQLGLSSTFARLFTFRWGRIQCRTLTDSRTDAASTGGRKESSCFIKVEEWKSCPVRSHRELSKVGHRERPRITASWPFHTMHPHILIG